MKNILITGSPFSWNYGSMALVVSSLQTLESINKDTTYFKGSLEKDQDLKRYKKYFPKKKLVIFGFNKKNMPMPLAVLILLIWSIPYYIKSDIVTENPGETTRDSWLISQFARFILVKTMLYVII